MTIIPLSAADFGDDGDRTMQYDSIHEMESDVVELGSDIVQPVPRSSRWAPMSSRWAQMSSSLSASSVDANGYVEPQRADATVEVDAMDESMDFFDEVPTQAFERDEPEPEPPRRAFPHAEPEPRARPQRAPEPSLKERGQVHRPQAGERQPVRHEERGGEAIVDFNEQNFRIT